MSPIKDRFDKDKQDLLQHTEDYLKQYPAKRNIPNYDYRSQAEIALKQGDFTGALQNLEKLRDQKTGIILHEVASDPNKTPVIIRDARNCKIPAVRETEAFEMQYLNAIRTAMDIANREGKPEVKAALQIKAEKFLSSFHTENKGLSQKEISKKLKLKTAELAESMKKSGIEDPYKKLNVSKDFQNLNDPHANIATIGSVTFKGKTHTVLEGEVALKGLTDAQKQEYQAIIEDRPVKPQWYNKMPAWEQKLVKQYALTIAKGEHVISTQLRQVVGLKNAFEKVTAVVEDPTADTPKLKVLHESKHAGTLVSFARDENSRQMITDLNSKQAQEWIGDDRSLHCNTLNSGPKLGTKVDREIVEYTTQSMKNVGGRETNTAINALRLSSNANVLDGAKETIGEVASSLDTGKEFDAIRSHLKPRGFVSSNLGTNRPQGNAKAEISKLQAEGKIGNETAKVLESTAELTRLVERSDVPLRVTLDLNNVGLQTSTKLNDLTKEISKLDASNSDSKGLKIDNMPKEGIVNMCASGKDRTGLAEQDQTAQAVATHIGNGAKAKDIDAQILASGHCAQQAGGVYSGGATVGCYGTKKDNIQSIPIDRMTGLKPIIEVSADSNNIVENKAIIKTLEKEGKIEDLRSTGTAKPQVTQSEKIIKTAAVLNRLSPEMQKTLRESTSNPKPPINPVGKTPPRRSPPPKPTRTM